MKRPLYSVHAFLPDGAAMTLGYLLPTHLISTRRSITVHEVQT